MAHRACEPIQLLQCETSDFIATNQKPPNSPDLNPDNYQIWHVMQQHVYKTRITNLDELSQQLIEVRSKILLTLLLASGESNCEPVFVHMGGRHFEHLL